MSYKTDKWSGEESQTRRYGWYLLFSIIVVLLFFEPSFCDGDDELDEQIEKAVKKGVKWLLSCQRRDGSFAGYYKNKYPAGLTALCLYALLSADVAPDSRAVKRAFAYLAKLPMKRVYSVSLLLLAVETIFRKQALKTESNRLNERQKELFKRADRVCRNIAEDCTRWLIKRQLPDGLWSYGTGRRRGDGSNTQFALLALYSALRLGIEVPSVVFARALRGVTRLQQRKGGVLKENFRVPAADYTVEQLRSGLFLRDVEEKNRAGVERRKEMRVRGFSYKVGQPVSFSMTAAGLSNIVICKFALGIGEYEKCRDVADAGIRDAAAYIATRYPYRAHNDDRWKWETQRKGMERIGSVWGYYRLYSLERAGTMGLLDEFGKHNWYKDGAKLLVVSQAPDGSWGRRCTVCTSFALLFLCRGTVAPIRFNEEDINRLKERQKLPAPKRGEGEPLGRFRLKAERCSILS